MIILILSYKIFLADNYNFLEFQGAGMKLIREYQRREFCKDIGCEAQKEIDGGDDAVYQEVREAHCKKCMAHTFHAWLNDKGYRVVILDD